MPSYIKNLCYFCKNYILCDGECRVGNHTNEIDEKGNLMYVHSCFSYEDGEPFTSWKDVIGEDKEE